MPTRQTLTGLLGLAAAAALLLPAATPAQAQGRKGKPEDAPRLDLHVKRVSSSAITVDGFITDWEGVPPITTRALTRGEHEYDWTGPKDLSLEVQALYDRDLLYLAVTVKDNIVTSKRGAKPGDHVELWFDAGPLGARSRHGRLRMLRLAPGPLQDGGKPAVTWGWPPSLRGAPEDLQADGAIRVDGYFFEIALPLTALADPPPGVEPIGFAAVARDYDYDDPGETDAAVATAPFDHLKRRDPATLGQLTLDGADRIKDGIYKLVPKAQGAPVIGQRFADVGGDARREYVQLIGRWLAVSGYGLGDGDYYYIGLPEPKGARFTRLETRDVTGDGKDELLVTWTLDTPTPVGNVQQELLAVYHFALDRIKLLFQQEIAQRGPTWTLSNTLTFLTPRGKPPSILLKPDKPQGDLSPDTYRDPNEGYTIDWYRPILPWGDERERAYTWDASQFIKKQ